MKSTIQATVAALCIFNGLKLSPVCVSVSRRFALVAPPVSPRFNQCRHYLRRFFDEGSSWTDYAPLEVFPGAVAAAPWIRGAVGTLQYTLFEEYGILVPDAHEVDPSAWFEDLEEFARLFAGHVLEDNTAAVIVLASGIQDSWGEAEYTATDSESNQFYLQRLYSQATALQAGDGFLASASAITKARNAKKFLGEIVYPFP